MPPGNAKSKAKKPKSRLFSRWRKSQDHDSDSESARDTTRAPSPQATDQQGPSVAGPSGATTGTPAASPLPADPSGPEPSEPTPADASQKEQKEEENLAPNLTLARTRLTGAQEKLKKKLPLDFQVETEADIASLKTNIGSALAKVTTDRNAAKSEQQHEQVERLVKEWTKKTLPFVEMGLQLANVTFQSLGSDLIDLECGPSSI
jgi:hypothetical protein